MLPSRSLITGLRQPAIWGVGATGDNLIPSNPNVIVNGPGQGVRVPQFVTDRINQLNNSILQFSNKDLAELYYQKIRANQYVNQLLTLLSSDPTIVRAGIDIFNYVFSADQKMQGTFRYYFDYPDPGTTFVPPLTGPSLPNDIMIGGSGSANFSQGYWYRDVTFPTLQSKWSEASAKMQYILQVNPEIAALYFIQSLIFGTNLTAKIPSAGKAYKRFQYILSQNQTLAQNLRNI